MQNRLMIALTGIIFCLSASASVAQTSAQDAYARGYARAQVGDLAGAIADYTKAIDLDPNYADAYYARGYVYSQSRNFEAAIADYTKEIEINPKDGKAYYARASLLDDRGEFAQAILDYTKLIELNPQDASAYNSRGVSYGKKGDYIHAVADYDKAVELDPKFARAYYNRGLAASLQGQEDKAILDYSRVLEIDPRSADALNSRARTYMRKGDCQAAIDDFTRAIELFPIAQDPQQASSYLGRAEAYIAQGMYDLAIADCEKVIGFYPRYADPYRWRAKAYYSKRATDKAWADVGIVRRLGQDVAMEFLLDLGAITPVDEELKKAGFAFPLREGWYLFMKATGVQKDLFGSLQAQSYFYMSADKKAIIFVALPIAMPDSAFARVREEIRTKGDSITEDETTVWGVPCSVLTRIDQTEGRRKTVSYHIFKDGKVYAFALSAREGEYGLYKGDFDQAVQEVRLFPQSVDGRAFYIDQNMSNTRQGHGSLSPKKADLDSSSLPPKTGGGYGLWGGDFDKTIQAVNLFTPPVDGPAPASDQKGGATSEDIGANSGDDQKKANEP